MRTLVTGAAGFVGSHVVRALLERGHDVRALVLPNDNLRNLRGLDVEVRLGDVCDADSVSRAVRGVDQVYHLAAIYALWTRDRGVRMHQVNVDGTRTVLAQAVRAGVHRVIHTSSIARFGGQGLERVASESSAFALGATQSAYALTKRDAHEVAVSAATAGQDVVIVAPCGPIGPGDVGPTPTGRLLLDCLSLPVIPVARTITNFIDVRDVAMGHVLAAEHGRAGETYLLGHRNLWLSELAAMAMSALGRSVPIIEMPRNMTRLAGRAMSLAADRVTHRAPVLTREAAAIAELGLAADASKAVRELGLPQSSLKRALADALEWFEREGHMARSKKTRLTKASTSSGTPRCRTIGSAPPSVPDIESNVPRL